MWACGVANMEAALAIIGPLYRIIKLWWQGEADAAGTTYEADFVSLRTRLYTELPWFKNTTPMVIYSVTPHYPGTPGDVYRKFNKVLARCVATDPEKLTFYYTGALSIAYWDAPTNYLHMTGEGYFRTGVLSYNASQGITGRATLDSVIVDPQTKQLMASKQFYVLSYTTTISASSYVGSFTAPSEDNTGGAFNASTGEFTVPITGLWTFTYMALQAGGAAATALLLHRNGVNEANGSALTVPSNASGQGTYTTSYTKKFNEGEVVKLLMNGPAVSLVRFSAKFEG